MKADAQTHSIDGSILKSIQARRHASIFSGRDFQHLGPPTAIRKALERLVKEGALRRVRRGYYDRPRAHPILGQTAPDPMDLIRGMMEKCGARWQVSGAYAANLLHISDQVPAKILVLTDVAPRKVHLQKLVLDFRRASPRNLLGAGTAAGLVFQALRHLGKDHVNAEVLARLKGNLDAATRNDLIKITPLSPAWMRPILSQLTTPVYP